MNKKILQATDKQLKELVSLEGLVKQAKKELKHRHKTGCGVCDHGYDWDFCPDCSH